MSKNKLLSVIICVFILIACSLSASANETYEINSYDINVIQRIYNRNSDVLDWNLNNPLTIENTEWELEGNFYYLTSLDLSNTEISGNVDLSQCSHIEYYSFYNTEINEVILPDLLSEIPESAFEDCFELEYVNIPGSINLISNKAFKNCSNLQSVIVNNNNTVIDSNAFSGCVSLKCVINANNITSIGRNAFSNCNNLVFYDTNILEEDSYIASLGYDYETTVTGSAGGYAGIMKYVASLTVDLSTDGLPYEVGIAYLYDENDSLISQSTISSTGYYNFNNLLIGHRYRLIIDGDTAIPRSEYFIVTDDSYSITTNKDALSIVVCDYNKDGLVTYLDVSEAYFKIANSRNMTEQELIVYDLDRDGVASSTDVSIVNRFLNKKVYYG